VCDLWCQIQSIGARRMSGGIDARRRRRARYLTTRAAADLVTRRIRLGDHSAVDALADRVLAGEIIPDAAAGRLIDG
jgi:hypothetical protein